MNALDRLARRTTYLPTTGCLLWTGATAGAGYGVVRLAGRMVYVHRLAYAELVGPIPEGHVMDHLCRRHACWAPGHLQPVTVAENKRRGWNLGPRKPTPADAPPPTLASSHPHTR